MENISSLKAVYIDDEKVNLMLLEAFGADFDLKIECFDDPIKGLEYILKHKIDIVYTDYMMPELDGIELIKSFRVINKDTPVVMITAAGEDRNLKLAALNAGATDFLAKPVDMAEFKARSLNLLRLRLLQLDLQGQVEKATAEIVEREHETLKVLGRTAEFKDPETGSHIARVAHYSKMLAKYHGLDDKAQDLIFYAAPFHDIGKVGTADAILLKPAKLDDDEFSIMKQHTVIGYEILKNASSRYLQEGAIIALNHHEKFDGTGYPAGKSGENIPLSARIVAVADVFDALTSIRPYKKAWSFDDAVEFLIMQSGKHFDPKLVNIFVQHLAEVQVIFNKHQDED